MNEPIIIGDIAIDFSNYVLGRMVYDVDSISKPITMTFKNFWENYDGEHHDIYILRDNKTFLYVGISKSNIWNRWFGNFGRIQAYSEYQWRATDTIGRIVVQNIPLSMDWIVHLIECPYLDIEKYERLLIIKLRPLFNSTHRDDLTDEENKLIRKYDPDLF